MKNRIRLALVAAATVASAAAFADATNLEDAYEAAAGDVRLPSNPRGQLVIRECSSCKPIVLRVDAGTRYLLAPSREPVAVEQLRTAIEAADDDDRLLTVFYSLKTGFVTRVVLSPAG
ncbi:MAG: hypothetical protein QY320_11095 [Gammaproteobacteria bacterium]|nr:MAG: hypothetical protein QY320_11095 [Gammaproteobacteria bacterium]